MGSDTGIDPSGDDGALNDTFPLTKTDWVLIYSAAPTSKPFLTKKTKKGDKPKPLTKEKQQIINEYTLIVQRLLKVGLRIRPLQFSRHKIAIFIQCPPQILARQVFDLYLMATALSPNTPCSHWL
jgi:hypothetical protein